MIVIKKWKKLDKYTKSAIIVITVAVLLRFIIASMSWVTGDPCWIVSVGRFIAENNRIPFLEPLGRPVFADPPLFQMMVAFFYKLFGVISKDLAEFSVKLVSPMFGGLTLAFVFLLAKRMYNSRIAFYSVIFVSFIPLHLYMSSIPYHDVTVAFFVLVSIYLLLKNKNFLSGIFGGLAILTKLTGFFLFPVSIFILYIKNKNKKIFFKKLVIFFIAVLMFSSIWYIRNAVYLGNPVWPYLDDAIGTQDKINPEFLIFSDAGITPSNLLKPEFFYRTYFSIFGVPGAGDIRNLFFVRLPFHYLFLSAWLLGTLLFIIPFLIYIPKINIKDKNHLILIVWFFSFFSFAVLNKMMNDHIIIRHSMSLIMPVAILWGLGLKRILSVKKKKVKLLAITILVFCIVGFVSIEFVKAKVVGNTWGRYERDFRWVENNIPKKAVVLVHSGDCYTYNFNKYSQGFVGLPNINTTDKFEEYNISHIWVNQKIDFYGGGGVAFSAAYPADFLSVIENYTLIYHNKETDTKVYKVK